MKPINLIFVLIFLAISLTGVSQQIAEKKMTLKRESSYQKLKKDDQKQIQADQSGSLQMIKPCSDADRIEKGIPEDFPRVVNTGNPKKDEDSYYKAQQVWIKNNPDRFRKIQH